MADSQQKPEYVLFFMENCNYCKKMLSNLKLKQELLKKFNIVNIDAVPVLPDEVDEVPCIYDGKKVYKGAIAFKWLNEKMEEYLSPANDGLAYAFLEGQEEQVFGNYSLLDQKNGSFGMGDNNADPARMMKIEDNTNKNRSLDTLMASRERELK
jgi:hypothetical protein